ncbi:MAG TPA: phosphopyruvate hydratase, partial [Candidatus Saccharimonadales bacterium]|nr:phosphopyruvate hydratase [Candidatus Saccharimonadales bacterium]
MPKIKSITCHKMLNSRADWTIATKVTLDDGSVGIQTIPEGASKGEHEAQYIPVHKSVEVVRSILNDALVGEDPEDTYKIDQTMIAIDGTPNKRELGGNSILSVSLACAKAAAYSQNVELYEFLAQKFGNVFSDKALKFPTPLFNILNGGKHASNHLSFQEFMVIPAPSHNYKVALEMGINCYHLLKKKLTDDGYDTDVGDEGGFAPDKFTVRKAFEYMRDSVGTKYKVGKDVFFGTDAASESFFFSNKYIIKEENLILNRETLADFYDKLIKDFPIMYIEDPYYEKDLEGWKNFNAKFGNKLLVSADDLVVTNPLFLKIAIEDKLANAVIVKPNQVGSLTETFEFIKMAQKAKMAIIVSHRSGDTEDTFIADLALA